MSPRQTRIGLWSLVVVALAIRIAYCAAGHGLGHTKPTSYLEYSITARRLLEHGAMVSPLPLDESIRVPSYLMPPAYVGVVAGVYRLFGAGTVTSVLILQIINAVATSLAVPVVFSVARRIGGPPAAWLAAIIATVHPSLFGFTDYIWDTSLFALCVIVCVWVSLQLMSVAVGWKRWLGFGLLLGAVALLNPALTVAYPLLVLWPLSRSCGWRPQRMVSGVLAVLCGWLVMITPWTVRNYAQFGELTYIRGGFMFQLWLGVCPEADSEGDAVFRKRSPMSNPDPDLQAKVISVGGEQAFIRECGERAEAAIRADPWRLARLVAVRAVDYWAGTLFTHAPAGGSGWPQSAPRAAVALFLSGEVLVIALCMLIRRRIGSDLCWLLAIAVSFSLVYCFTHVMGRFRTPSETVIAVVVAVSVVNSGLCGVKRCLRPLRETRNGRQIGN